MRIFITGATGYIGNAVARRLMVAGHSVVGLTRSPEKAEALAESGIAAVVGDLAASSSYLDWAATCDVLIHAGFDLGPRALETDRRAVEALASCALASPRKLLIYTSGVWVLGPQPGRPADEDAALDPPAVVRWRPAHEALALRAGAVVIRPGCVYGERAGLYGLMLRSLFDERVVRLPGDGSNRWASVYLDDLAELYRLAAERRPAGRVFHATDGSSDALRRTAEALLDAAGGGEIEELEPRAAQGLWGELAPAMAMDQLVSSDRARRELGWRPQLVSPAANAQELLAEWHEHGAALCAA